MMWRARSMLASRAREVRTQAIAQDMVGSLRAMNVALDRQGLNRQGHQRQDNHHDAQTRRSPRGAGRGRGMARGAWSIVASVDHLARKRTLILGIYARPSEMPPNPVSNSTCQGTVGCPLQEAGDGGGRSNRPT